MAPDKLIHAQLCADCLARLGQLEPLSAVRLPHPNCMFVFTQGLRVIAQHPEYAFALLPARVSEEKK